jgi:lysozyme family protein
VTADGQFGPQTKAAVDAAMAARQAVALIGRYKVARDAFYPQLSAISAATGPGAARRSKSNPTRWRPHKYPIVESRRFGL